MGGSMQRQLLAGTGLARYEAAPDTARMSNHGAAMCRVAVTSGQDVYAKPGAMVAYDGFLQYEAVSQTFRRALGEWASGSAARCCGGSAMAACTSRTRAPTWSTSSSPTSRCR